MQIKNRIILFFYFAMMAFFSLLDPAPGARVMIDHRDAEEKRKAQARAAGAVRVGDKA